MALHYNRHGLGGVSDRGCLRFHSYITRRSFENTNDRWSLVDQTCMKFVVMMMCVVPWKHMFNILKKLLSAFMSYIIIHSKLHSSNRVVQPFLPPSLSPSCFLTHPQFPCSGGMCRDWWKITLNCFRELSIHDNGNWSFLLCTLHLGLNRAALPTPLLSLTIKWWLILAYISIQLQYLFDFDAVDS